jgi:hypothetical protein
LTGQDRLDARAAREAGIASVREARTERELEDGGSAIAMELGRADTPD